MGSSQSPEATSPDPQERQRESSRIYELRTYVALPGKWDELVAQFRDHLVGILRDHNIMCHGFWKDHEREDALVYLASHSGDPQSNWDSFRTDARWAAVRRASSTGDQIISPSFESRSLIPLDIYKLQQSSTSSRGSANLPATPIPDITS